MADSPKRKAVFVGLLVATSLGILAGGVLTIGDLRDTFVRRVTITTVFDGVNGLKPGDNIWYSGLKVGIVKGLGFHGSSRVRVEMNIDSTATEFIHQDSQAKIGSNGLIGSTIVVLYGGTPGSPGVVEGDELASGKTVSTEEILTMLQENGDNLLAITGDLKVITAKLARGEGTLGKLLGDEALYTEVTETVATLHTASGSARSLTASLAGFSADLNRPGTLSKSLVTDRTTYGKLTGAVDELAAASGKTSALVGSVAEGVADPRTPLGTLLHDHEAGEDLKVTLDQLQRTTLLLNDDLEALQHNFLLRGFFKKREKAAEKAEKETRAKDTRRVEETGE